MPPLRVDLRRLGGPLLPFCEGAGYLVLVPGTVGREGPVVVARAVSMFVGDFPEFLVPAQAAAKARDLVAAGLIEQPRPVDAPALGAAFDRSTIGRKAGAMLVGLGLRVRHTPKLRSPALREAPLSARYGPVSAAPVACGPPTLRIVR